MALTKAQSRKRWAELRALVNAWDPLGLIADGAPADEYECLCGPLMRLLETGASATDMSAFLAQEFSGHFGVEGHPDEAERLRFTERARAWFIERPSGA